MEVSKIKGLLKEKRGNVLPLACAIVMVIILIFSVVSEYMRLQIIAKGVRDALQTSAIAAASQNYECLYNGLRDGYSGAYTLSSSDTWESKINQGDVYNYLDNLLNLNKNGEDHIKLTGDKEEYKLSDLKINIINAPLAPQNPDSSDKFQIEAYIHLEVPISFGWEKLPPLQINLKVKAGYTPKF